MPDNKEDGNPTASRFTDFMRATDVTNRQAELTDLLRVVEGGGEPDAIAEIERRIQTLAFEVATATVAFYLPGATLEEVGRGWVFNGAEKGYGVKWGNDALQLKIKDKKYNSKDITKARALVEANPHHYQLPGRREVFVEAGELATALPMALELGGLSEDRFHDISGGSDTLTTRVATIDTFATLGEIPKTFRFTPEGIIEIV